MAFFLFPWVRELSNADTQTNSDFSLSQDQFMQYRFNAGRRQVVEPYLTVPESCDPAECLPASLRKRDDDARYLPSVIHHHQMIGKVDDRGWVPLKADYLARVMAEDDCKKVVQALLSAGVIERDYYIVGKKSFSYRLGSRFENDRFIKWPIECKRLKRAMVRLAEMRLEVERSRMLPVHHYLLDMQASLTIDRGSAMQLLPSFNDKFGCQAMLVDRLCEGVHSFSVGRFGRVSNSICNLKKELRPSLRLQNQPLGSLDLSNSQPALLGKILKDNGRREKGRGNRTGNHIYDPENRGREIELDRNEVAEYVSLVQSGAWYEELMKAFPNYTRKEIQTKFLADVVAKCGTYPSEVEDYFRYRFPTIHAWIKRFNHFDHAALIRELQREESRLVIETVAETLRTEFKDLPFLTLHDGVFAPSKRLGEVRQAFYAAFEANGFPMKMKMIPDLSNPKEVAA